MKKQYRDTYHNWHSFNLCIYHDGRLVESKIVDLGNIDFEIDKLEKNGYSYGYSAEDIEDVREEYEYMLENVLVEPDEEIVGE